MRHMGVVATGLALLSLGSAAVALGSRAPTLREREQITKWYPAFIRNAPVECVYIVIRISSRDARYARTYPQVLNWRKKGSRCGRYAANGFYILKRRQARWRLVWQGSTEPSCSLKIPRDLTHCRS